MYGKTAVALALLLALQPAMAATKTPQMITYGDEGYPQREQVNVLAQKIVNELLLTNDVLSTTQPIVVTTPVNVDDFTRTGHFARQLQQGMMAALHARYFNVVDTALGQTLRVTDKGDLLLSRDWQRLRDVADTQHVLVANYSLGREGLVVNSRILDISNSRVVAASQSYSRPGDLRDYLAYSEQVVAKDGLLYRNEAPGMDMVRLLGEDK
ncbi:FlgO family outer membrane protein [Shewanella sp.]|uniref:FlgO family outer membrane protein n=1 Tax=Shewanella sp. TaxID=50422 RepID=UPI00356198F6